MKTLSLLQPWAQLCVTKSPLGDFAIKSWETRSWKPSAKNLDIIQQEGMLIHASLKLAKPQLQLLNDWPFNLYRNQTNDLYRGHIIGWVRVGRILTTQQWMEEIRIQDRDDERWAEEEQFGDYRPERYAWEMLEFKKLKHPIKMSGSLSLWDFDLKRDYPHLDRYLKDPCNRNN